MQSDSNHAYHPDPAKPLAESITPIIGDKAVLCQLYPEGNLTALGYIDPYTGEFIGTSGSFRAYRKATIILEEK